MGDDAEQGEEQSSGSDHHTAAVVLQGIRLGSTTQAPNAINERSRAAVTELERSFSSKSLAAPGVAVDQLVWVQMS